MSLPGFCANSGSWSSFSSWITSRARSREEMTCTWLRIASGLTTSLPCPNESLAGRLKTVCPLSIRTRASEE